TASAPPLRSFSSGFGASSPSPSCSSMPSVPAGVSLIDDPEFSEGRTVLLLLGLESSDQVSRLEGGALGVEIRQDAVDVLGLERGREDLLEFGGRLVRHLVIRVDGLPDAALHIDSLLEGSRHIGESLDPFGAVDGVG